MIQKYNADPVRCADLMNGTVFKGKQMVEAKYLINEPRKKSVIVPKEKDVETVQEINSSKECDWNNEKISEILSYEERERDIFRLHDHPFRKFYIACEAQANADYNMPVRELLYDGIEYYDQLDSGKHTNIDDAGSVKYLLPVFHLVLYHGWNRWLSKHCLQEMMNVPKDMEEFRDLLPEYKTYVVDIHEQNPELFKTEWADVFRLMGHSRKKEELKKYMEQHKEEIQRLSKDTRMLLAVLLDQYEIMDDGKVEVRTVCEAWDGAMQMYFDEAYERATKEYAARLDKDVEEAVEKAVGIAVEKAVEEAVEKAADDAAKENMKFVEQLEGKYQKLISILLGHKKYDDLERISCDKEYCHKLFAMYGV